MPVVPSEEASSASELGDYENDGANCEVHGQTPVFAEERMLHGVGQMRHEQEVNGIAREHGKERIEEIANHSAVRHGP